MKAYFEIKDLQIETAILIYPFSKVLFIFADLKADYYSVWIDDKNRFNITKEQYQEYMDWLNK